VGFFHNTKLLAPNGSDDCGSDITATAVILLFCWVYSGSISGNESCVCFIIYHREILFI